MSKRKQTSKEHQEKVNEALYLIHKDISEPLHVKSIAQKVATSPYHFNRIFFQVTGEHLHEYILRVRLESAANQLLFNPDSTITDISRECGFSSSSTFTHAFKKRFFVTPSKWREIDEDRDVHLRDIEPLHVEPTIRKIPATKVAYVRHRGYDRSIKRAWLKLYEWAEMNAIDTDTTMIGLHHSNPRFVEKSKCHYVACLELKDEAFRGGDIGVMKIPSMLCAVFRFEGVYGDLLKYMDSVYYKWLPKSGYEKVNLPSLAIYHKNHFIDEDERFVLDLCVPVRYC